MKQLQGSDKYKDFILALMAGIIVGFGGIVLLSTESPYLGAFLFAGALFIILSLKYNLFTGMIGYFFYNEKISYSKRLFVVLIANLLGTFLVANLIKFTRIGPDLVLKAQERTAVKLSDSLGSMFVLSIFCNMFVTNATHQFKYNPYQVGKYLAIFISIMTFVLSSFEHSIADSFYFFLAGEFNKQTILVFLVVLFGNIIGGLVIPTVALLYDDNFRLKG
ncbi:formate/nitrite transporter family protein [Anaerococcus sp.]|uniref:formate/nitrite transporter family protein n=1 Tax=Anaerococcus sp. TaxID=1872515 RepID=UPI0029003C7D|nr:formate/nitrite transporter family protein [Anaerococcus sp.]MDU1828817.1 formate/nitrite transporter family protein [Anaerococcus sp.]MDU1865180.1 formate/nitrite transporter family protein [Anaerococcus sp.]